ncbi:hypothetical protein EIK77_004546 [Talaromyces pinophilus]|nr:hypothetical protein EIK77_004546 [Talaromyces pinophilus]
MFPSFLSPIDEGVQSQHVDVEPILCCMREITAAYDSRYSEAEHGTDRASQYYLWASSGPSKLLSAVIDAHISSITDNTEKNNSGLSPKVKSSWSGICIAVGLYLTSVLGVWNQGHPPENRLLYHNLRILRQDLDDNLADIMGEDIFAQQLWFWKAFLGALSLAHAGFVADEGVGTGPCSDIVGSSIIGVDMTVVNRYIFISLKSSTTLEVTENPFCNDVPR